MNQQDQHKEFLERTIQIWQPFTDRELTPEDAHEIVENVAGFFSLLLEWDAEARSRQDFEDKDDRSTADRDEVAR